MIRLGGRASGDRFRRDKDAFERYNFLLIEVSSIRFTYGMFVYAITMLGVLAMLCIPVGIAFVNLKSIWVDCVPIPA